MAVLELGVGVVLPPPLPGPPCPPSHPPQVALPPDVPLGNELRLHFPADLFGFNANGRATRAVVLAGLDAMPQLPPTVAGAAPGRCPAAAVRNE